MGNKRDPRKVTVTDEPTLLTSLTTRRSLMMANIGNDVSLHHLDDFAYDEGFPWSDGSQWNDDKSSDQYYAICDTGLTSDVWVWETE